MFIDFGDLYVYGICVVCKCYNNKYFLCLWDNNVFIVFIVIIINWVGLIFKGLRIVFVCI